MRARALVHRIVGRRPRVPPGRPTPRVAVLGTGFGGIAAAIRLRQAGIDDVTLYEKADAIGGTWRDNTYPGAECDVPSHLYSFSFALRPDWSRHYPRQPEILEYLERCVDEHGLRDRIRFGAEVTELRWDDDELCWHLRTAAGDEATADVVVSGLGQLNRPSVPDLPGLEAFGGAAFHSARWDHDHDLTGERVGVVGTGASAVQLVPPVADLAGHLTLFQRSPNWVGPKPNPAFSERTRAAFAAVPGLARAYRSAIYLVFEARWPFLRRSNRLSGVVESLLVRYLRSQVHDPVKAEQLVPDFPLGCRRILATDDYLRTVDRPDVSLVTAPVVRVEPDGVVTADGVHHPLDALVLATGFRSTEFLAPVAVTGRGGRALADAWVDGAEAHLGVTVAGFPNLFLLYGPNTNLGHSSIVFMLERQVELVVQLCASMVEHGVAAVDVRPEVQARSNRALQDRLADTVWAEGCGSWYVDASGRITNNWAGPTIRYWWEVLVPDPRDYEALRRPGGPAAHGAADEALAGAGGSS